MRKSLGSKRRELGEDDIAKLVEIHGAFEEGEYSKILPNEAFGYRTITVERPLRLNFQVSDEPLARLNDEASLTKNGLDLGVLKKALRAIGTDLNDAAAYADRLMLLGCDRVLACASPDEVLQPQLIERAYGIPMLRVDTPHAPASSPPHHGDAKRGFARRCVGAMRWTPWFEARLRLAPHHDGASSR
jgi:hypothetical protein